MWVIVFLYFPKSEVKMLYFIFGSTHVSLSSFVDSYIPVALSILNYEYGSTLLYFFVWRCPSSPVQYQLTVPIPFGILSFETYSCHYIINGGFYLVSEHVFIWSHVRICIVINYYWWPIRSKSKFILSIPLLKIIFGISYPLKLCRKPRVYFWCGLWEAFLLPSK